MKLVFRIAADLAEGFNNLYKTVKIQWPSVHTDVKGVNYFTVEKISEKFKSANFAWVGDRDTFWGEDRTSPALYLAQFLGFAPGNSWVHPLMTKGQNMALTKDHHRCIQVMIQEIQDTGMLIWYNCDDEKEVVYYNHCAWQWTQSTRDWVMGNVKSSYRPTTAWRQWWLGSKPDVRGSELALFVAQDRKMSVGHALNKMCGFIRNGTPVEAAAYRNYDSNYTAEEKAFINSWIKAVKGKIGNRPLYPPEFRQRNEERAKGAADAVATITS